MSSHSPPTSTNRSRGGANHLTTLAVTSHSHSRLPTESKNPLTDFLNNDTTTTTNPPSMTSRSRSTHHTTATQGITVTKRSRVQSPLNKDTSEVSFEEGFSLYAFGDLSMSEAYNAPAPTTGEYPLRLKRTRPPKPRKLQLEKDEDGDNDGGDTENLLQHLCRPEYPLSPASDFKRFVEGLQSAKVASPTPTRTTGVSLSKYDTQVQDRLVGSTGDEGKVSKASRGSLSAPLQTGVPTLSPAIDLTDLQSAHSKTAFPPPFLSKTASSSPFLSKMEKTSVSTGKRTNTQPRPFAGVKTSSSLRGAADLSLSATSSSVLSKAKARDRLANTGHIVVKARV